MTRTLAVIVGVWAVVGPVAHALAAEPVISVVAGSDPTRVTAVATLFDGSGAKLPAGDVPAEKAEKYLRLTLIDPGTKKPGPAILGRYVRAGNLLRFTPRYALTHGQTYRATMTLPGRKDANWADYRVPPRKPTKPAVVEAIYPSASHVPANMLKFYIHFSKPMREGRAIFDKLHILGPDGKPVHDPWRRLDLWSPDAKRLTLWVHPGRVKQGVNLREQFGPILREGGAYTLVIDADLLDADGQPLGKPFTKKFTALADDRIRPTIDRWKLTPPPAGTRLPLALAFPEPLDRWLLERDITVRDRVGRVIEGRVEVGSEERSWRFHPAQPWRETTYVVTVAEEMEDLAGNTPVRIFDTDLTEPSLKPGKRSVVFEPVKAAR